MENRDAATNSTINEMVKSAQLTTPDGRIISIMSLFALHQIAVPIAEDDELIRLTSKFLAIAPAVKPETKAKWLEIITG